MLKDKLKWWPSPKLMQNLSGKLSKITQFPTNFYLCYTEVHSKRPAENKLISTDTTHNGNCFS